MQNARLNEVFCESRNNNELNENKIVMVEKRIFMLMPRKTYAIFRYIHQIIIVVITIISITMGARVCYVRNLYAHFFHPLPTFITRRRKKKR